MLTYVTFLKIGGTKTATESQTRKHMFDASYDQ